MLRWLLPTLLTWPLWGTTCWAGPFPVEVVTNIAGVSFASAPSLTAEAQGSARFGIEGTIYEGASRSDPLVPVGEEGLGDLVKTAHVFQMGNGDTLNTTDELHLRPTQPGWFVVSGTLTITGGTGIFATATGAMDVMGTIHVTDSGVDTLLLVEGPLIYWLF